MRLGGTFKFTPGAFGSESTTNVDLLQAYPDVIRVGAAWRVTPRDRDPPRRRLAALEPVQGPVHRQPGHVVQRDSSGVVLHRPTAPNVVLDLPRDWKDSMKVRLGVAYWVTPATEIHASASWSRRPSARATRTRSSSTRRASPAPSGVRHGFTSHLYGALSYTYVYLLPVTVNDSVYTTLPPAFDVPFDERELLVGALHLRRVDDLPLLTGRSSRPHRVLGVGLFAAAAFPAPTPRMTRDGDEPSPTGVWALV